MAGIWVILEVIDYRADNCVIGAAATGNHTQFAVQHPKQFFDVAMLLTEYLNDVCHCASYLQGKTLWGYWRHDIALDQKHISIRPMALSRAASVEIPSVAS